MLTRDARPAAWREQRGIVRSLLVTLGNSGAFGKALPRGWT
jgi:hypothetical protein